MSGVLEILRRYGTVTIAVALAAGAITYLAIIFFDVANPLQVAIATAVLTGCTYFLVARKLKQARSVAGQDLDDRLIDLKMMLVQGRITKTEHERLRKKILDTAFDG